MVYFVNHIECHVLFLVLMHHIHVSCGTMSCCGLYSVPRRVSSCQERNPLGLMLPFQTPPACTADITLAWVKHRFRSVTVSALSASQKPGREGGREGDKEKNKAPVLLSTSGCEQQSLNCAVMEVAAAHMVPWRSATFATPPPPRVPQVSATSRPTSAAGEMKSDGGRGRSGRQVGGPPRPCFI